jgi:ubiquinone/menaquinone biosynthesis C-methylase UbiE/biotin operon repressor
VTPSIVKSLRVLADPTRLRLLLLLRHEELSVAELQQILGMGQSRISSHLSQLKQAGLVFDRRAGKNIYYAPTEATEPHQKRLFEVVAAGAAEIPEAKQDRTALELVLKKRQDKAREYFNHLAGKFGRSYCPGRSWKAVAHLLSVLVPPMTIADLGAGEGTLAQFLAGNARRVIAIDNSEKMVEFGSELVRKHGFDNIEYRLGDIEDPPIKSGTVDLAVLSQALHHASNPARAVTSAFRILRSGGRIVVLDLLAHSFEQARESYADLWLGFSEVQMHDFLRAAGFTKIDVSIVGRETESPHFQTLFATGLKP